MQIHPDQRISEAQLTAASQLTADIDIVGTVQGSNNGSFFDNVSPIFLPANHATPLPHAILNYAYFRIATPESVPFMRNITVSAAGEDLVVPDLIKTRSTTIERDEDGNITKITKVGGREIDITRDVDGNVEELTDGTRTWTVGRDVDGNVEEVTVV